MTTDTKEWKSRAAALVSAHAKRSQLFERYRRAYFMDNMDKPKDGSVDAKDFKLTVSPGSRNEVVGAHRLLETSEMNIEIRARGGERVDRVEEGLQTVFKKSRNNMTTLNSDAALSAVLYGPVILYAESIQDRLKSKQLTPHKKRLLMRQLEETPFIVKVLNPEECFAEVDEGEILFHVQKTKVAGNVLKSRYGAEGINERRDYTVYDCYDPEYHYVWADGLNADLVCGPHGLDRVPISMSYTGGSSLFFDPHQQMQSYLYAKVMSDMDKRENSVLSAIFTQLHRRGMLGEMYWIDPTDAPEDIKIDYQNGVYFAKGKVTARSDKVIDPVVFEIKAMIDDLSGQSTIYKQTLGENINHSTFSGLAMLSSAGKLPLVPLQRAMENAFRDVSYYMLDRIKKEGIVSTIINPMDIPDNLEVNVSFDPKLPQDALRNAQIAAQIGDKLSTEWMHTNLFQINDTPAMERQIMLENAKKAIFSSILQNPETMQQIVAKIIKTQKPPAQVGRMGMPPEGMPREMNGMGMPPEGMPPEGMPPEGMPGMGGMPGMPPGVSGNPNMMGVGHSDAMIPPMERGL